MSRRLEKVNEFIKQEVSKAISLLQDEVFGIVTVTSVETQKDLKKAIVWISILSPNKEASLRKLKKRRGQIQHLVNQKFSFKNTPKIDFEYDTSGEYSEKIENIIREIKEGEE